VAETRKAYDAAAGQKAREDMLKQAAARMQDTEIELAVAKGAAKALTQLLADLTENSVGGLMGVLATMAGSLLPSAVLAVGAGRMGERFRQARGMRAFQGGLAPVAIGLLLATGAVLLRPVAASPTAWLLVAGTLGLMLRTKLNPMWAIAAGALVGAAGGV
jgi:chromate transporter